MACRKRSASCAADVVDLVAEQRLPNDGTISGSPLIAAYTGSKHAVVGITKAAAVEHAKDCININAVCPGIVNTSMTLECKSGLESAPCARSVPSLAFALGREQMSRTPRWPHTSRTRRLTADQALLQTSALGSSRSDLCRELEGKTDPPD